MEFASILTESSNPALESTQPHSLRTTGCFLWLRRPEPETDQNFNDYFRKWSHKFYKILGDRRVKRIEHRTERPQILDATIKRIYSVEISVVGVQCDTALNIYNGWMWNSSTWLRIGSVAAFVKLKWAPDAVNSG
jgi:hypothetical protein